MNPIKSINDRLLDEIEEMVNHELSGRDMNLQFERTDKTLTLRDINGQRIQTFTITRARGLRRKAVAAKIKALLT